MFVVYHDIVLQFFRKESVGVFSSMLIMYEMIYNQGAQTIPYE